MSWVVVGAENDVLQTDIESKELARDVAQFWANGLEETVRIVPVFPEPYDGITNAERVRPEL